MSEANPKPTARASAWLQFDFVDLLLLAASGAAVGLVYSWLLGDASVYARLLGLLVFVPLIARRALFKMPERGEVRSGRLWSTVSIASGVGSVIGVVLLAFGAWGFFETLKPEPDHSSEIAHELDEYGAAGFPAKKPGESTSDVLLRLDRGLQSGRENYKRQLLTQRHEMWVTHIKGMRKFGWACFAIGFGFMALGAAVDRARYKRG